LKTGLVPRPSRQPSRWSRHHRPSARAHSSQATLVNASNQKMPSALVSALLMSSQGATVAAAVPEILAWQRAIAGAGAFCTATLVTCPLDSLKVRMQVRKQDSSASSVRVAWDMVLHEGMAPFFAGIGPALLMTPAAVCQYTLVSPTVREPYSITQFSWLTFVCCVPSISDGPSACKAATFHRRTHRRLH
jgi:hypothetical protein